MEFGKRTRPMEIMAGETACYRILAFIAMLAVGLA
jgi:hypothetical protein